MIRAATGADALAIQKLWNLAIRATLITFNSVEKSPEDVANAIRDNDVFLVAQEDDQIIGFASFAPFRAGSGYAFTKEHSIMIAPKARGRGAGRALMDALEAEARAQGVRSLIAGVSGSNPDGEPFHATMGYQVVGRLPQVGRKFEKWHDLVLMQKFL